MSEKIVITGSSIHMDGIEQHGVFLVEVDFSIRYPIIRMHRYKRDPVGHILSNGDQPMKIIEEYPLERSVVKTD
jgi:hypothetical protein